uniref:Cell cycle regulator of non-homologous end joining isoform X3 n=1 Tax=Camelus bactrianus TaxID=9837 RepID=A0A9W3FUK1_CAMBA|nr:cell cycle regulator of non-homologous end joining isoform X3 [Camelus bactrianus]
MEALEAGTKKRVLPTWMTAQEVEKRTTQVKIPKRRRTAVVPAATARLPATRTVYCMNEAEIVDVALGILIEFPVFSFCLIYPSLRAREASSKEMPMSEEIMPENSLNLMEDMKKKCHWNFNTDCTVNHTNIQGDITQSHSEISSHTY